MQIKQTIFDGAYLIQLQPAYDERGFFVRTFCERFFQSEGLCSHFVQNSSSFSKTMGTLRGMHFQKAPHTETKLVRCWKGVIWDVIVDLRRDSSTYGQWQGFTLSAESWEELYIPAGFAHGFQSLADDVEVSYLISEFYTVGAASGVRFNDPAFAIDWPLPVSVISQRDMSWPDYIGLISP
jgi:dTDP-4-dehydrorhamnose 3,5-epimerase